MEIKTFSIQTNGFFDIHDLTDQISAFLKDIQAGDGQVNVFTRHTTVAIKINEKEDGFLKDLEEIVFTTLAPKDRPYLHNNTHIRDPKTMCPVSNGQDCLNGHSHVAQMLLGTSSETVPVQNGEMMLGTWQRIMMFELDRPRSREVIISYLGNRNQE